MQREIAEEIQRQEGLMTEMEVVCRPQSQLLPDGNLVKEGKNTIRVYTDNVPQVMAMLETEPEKIADAQVHFERGLARHIEQTGSEPDKGKATFGGSVEASFRELYDRHILPLSEAKVLKEGIQPLHRAKEHKRDVARIQDIADAVLPTLIREIRGAAPEQSGKGKR